MDTGKLIREKRKEAGLSQETLAKRAGVSRRALIYWEQGYDISVRTLGRLLEILGCELKISA